MYVNIEVKLLKKKLNPEEFQQELVDIPVNLFGYELIRTELLSNLLGKDAEPILYWAGKELARKHPVASYGEMVSFFEEVSFGTLNRTKEKRTSHEYILSGKVVKMRLADKSAVFSLEAGFLAEQMQLMTGMYTEGYAERTKKNEVLITLQWDKKDVLIHEEENLE